MAFSVGILIPKAAYPLATSSNTSIGRFAGDEAEVPDVSLALGGTNSEVRLLPEQHLPLIQSKAPTQVPTGTVFAYRLFRDITAAEATAGTTIYRGVFITVDKSMADLKVYSSKGPQVGTLTMATETPSTSITGNKYVQRIPTEFSAPTGPVFAAASSGSPLSLGAISPGGVVFLWLKLAIGAGASAQMYDTFTLTFTDGTDTNVPAFFHTVGTGVTSATVSGQLDGAIVQHPYGDTFTVSTTNSSGTLTDPPSNTVLVYTASSFSNLVQQDFAAGKIPSGSLVGQAIRASTGVYKYAFRPSAPGHYFLTFDCGGEVQVTRNVEVSPVA